MPEEQKTMSRYFRRPNTKYLFVLLAISVLLLPVLLPRKSGESRGKNSEKVKVTGHWPYSFTGLQLTNLTAAQPYSCPTLQLTNLTSAQPYN